VLFINPRSGGGTATRHRVAERARDRGIEAVILNPGQDLAALTQAAVTNGADALGVAGGDGSLAVVAAAAAAHDLPFVCIPAGTRNHFALDVGWTGRMCPARSRRSPVGLSAGSTWRT
jgi:diacylglycerol kinase family enzyme